jgi:hypothetical protein
VRHHYAPPLPLVLLLVVVGAKVHPRARFLTCSPPQPMTTTPAQPHAHRGPHHGQHRRRRRRRRL